MCIQRKVTLQPDLLDSLAIPDGSASPFRRWTRVKGLLVLRKLNAIERLQQTDQHERHLVVRELLAETDARTGVEGHKDEGIRREVFV